MTKFLISFPSSAMAVPEADLPAVADAAHAVAQEAKDAGVWVFGGAINDSILPVMVDGEGNVTQATYPQMQAFEGGYCILELPTHDDAIAWATKLAAACRCAQEVRAFHYDPES